jgi:hypothetical protein
MTTTRPAPSNETAEVPPSSQVTPLARAALELGVDSDDVLAYLTGQPGYRKSSDTFAAVVAPEVAP